MLIRRCEHTLEREKALAEGIKDVASELRSVDAVDLIAFVRTEQFANVRSLVNASTELFFKPGTIKFGSWAEVDLKWGKPPSVVLDMEFHHMDLDVYFRLHLGARQAAVEITYISFGIPARDPHENTRRLVEAIADARIAPLPQTSEALDLTI
jgi:hypothetical protein